MVRDKLEDYMPSPVRRFSVSVTFLIAVTEAARGRKRLFRLTV